MKKKIITLIVGVIMLAMMLTSCIQNDIGIKMNEDGTGSISATIGIEKDFYNSLIENGSDPFEGKSTKEYTFENKTYVSYTEAKEYGSYEEMEKALLDMTYDTSLIDNMQNSEEESEDGNLTVYGNDTKTSDNDNHIFSSVNIESNSGIFYSSYTFNAVMNPQSDEGLDYDMNSVFKVTLTVEMPEEITQSKGGKVEGKKIIFDIADISESQEFAATCESNNTGIVIGIVAGLALVVAGIFFFIKFKK